MSASLLHTAAGRVQGRSTSAADVEVFYDVPFARPIRFRPPTAPEDWSGIRHSGNPGPSAPQPMASPPETDEFACLNATIWRPSRRPDLLPVVLFVHGGSNQFGSHRDAVSDGTHLASHGLIVIAAQYRLGALGFLRVDHHLGEEYSESGALAVHDIVAALRWVQDNAAALGADASRVTLMGHSAGAALAATVAASPLAAGFFHRLIMQSGTAERVQDADTAADTTDRLLEICGLRPDELLTCDPSRLMAGQTAISAPEVPPSGLLPMPFKCQLGTMAVPCSPLQAFQDGACDDIALLAGTNLVEGAAFTEDFGPEEVRRAWAIMSAGMSPHARALYVRALALFGDPQGEDRLALNHVLTDVQYRRPTDRLLSARRRSQPSAATYGYVFDGRAVIAGSLASAHGSELPFTFGNVGGLADAGVETTRTAGPISKQISAAWAGFIIEGEPGPTALWPPTTVSPPQLKLLGGPPPGELSYVPNQAAFDPWAGIRDVWESSP